MWKDDTYLDGMRQRMDPLADDAVRAIFEGGAGAVEGFISLFKLHDLPAEEVAELPKEVQLYLREQAKAPEWQDDEKLKIGERIQGSHGLLTLGIMACASLPECYVDWRGMKVLWLTQQLAGDNIGRRVTETLLYLAYVLSCDGWKVPDGAALDATRKVRLMHAATRYLVLADENTVKKFLPPETAQAFIDTPKDYWLEHGQPINQEDLAYTLLTFSWVAVRGLRQLNVGLTREEEEAILHCWRVSGYHMGIDLELLPEGLEETEVAFDTMKSRLSDYEPQDDRGEQGRALTQALLDYAESDLLPRMMKRLDHLTTHRYFLTQEKLQPLPRMLMLHLVGKETALQLGIRDEDFTAKQRRVARRWLWLVKTMARIREWGLDRIPGYRWLSDFVFEKVTGLRWERLASEGGKIPFTRPIGHWSGEDPSPKQEYAEASDVGVPNQRGTTRWVAESRRESTG